MKQAAPGFKTGFKPGFKAGLKPGFKLGTENKKQVYILAGLAVVALVVLILNFSGGSGESSSAPRAARPAITDPALADATHPDSSLSTRRRTSSHGDLKTWAPRFGPSKGGHIDPSRIDPTLRLDLLAKLQSVEVEAGGRNLFQLGPAPAPDGPVKAPPKIIPGPIAIAPTGPVAPVVPQAPPIDLKYYGYSTVKGEARRKAFLLDGEDIIMAFEGETVKRRYKVVKINATSVTMEDTQFKSTQTLPLQPESNG
jgi:hypothetical protein